MSCENQRGCESDRGAGRRESCHELEGENKQRNIANEVTTPFRGWSASICLCALVRRFDSSTIDLIALQLVCVRRADTSMSGKKRHVDEVIASACGSSARAYSPLWSTGLTPRLVHKSSSTSVRLVEESRTEVEGECARERGRAGIMLASIAHESMCSA